jgi:hypothetical protein
MDSKKFRSRTNTSIAIVVWFFAASTVAVNLSASRLGLGVIGALVLISAIAWLLFWRPTVSVDDEGIWVQNPLRKTRCDYSNIQAVDGRFGLILLHNDTRFTVWAVTGRDSEVARDVFDRWKASQK